MSNRPPCIEGLEPRLLLTTLMGGDVFEYQDASDSEHIIRIALSGNIIVEFIAADVDPSNNIILGDIPGLVTSGSRSGLEILGGIGGGDGVELIGPIVGDGVDDQEPDDIVLQALASMDLLNNGRTFAFNVATVSDIKIIRLIELTVPPSGSGPVDTEISALLGEAFLDADPNTGDTTALTGDTIPPDVNDFAIDPTTGLCYAVTEESGVSELFTVDRITGEVTRITTGAGGHEDSIAGGDIIQIEAMAFDSTGNFYVIGKDNTGTNARLGQIDPATGSLIGAAVDILDGAGGSNITLTYGGMVFDSGDILYAAAKGTNAEGKANSSLHRITFDIGGGTATRSVRGAIQTDEETPVDMTIDALTYAVNEEGDTVLVGVDNGQAAGTRLVRIEGDGKATPKCRAGAVATVYGLASFTEPGDTRPLLFATDSAVLIRGAMPSLPLLKDASAVESIAGADFRPTTGSGDDGWLFFSARCTIEKPVFVDGEWKLEEVQIDQLYKIEVRKIGKAAIQNTLTYLGDIDSGDDNVVTSLAWELDATAADGAYLYGYRQTVSGEDNIGQIFRIDPTDGTISNRVRVYLGADEVTDITGIEFVNDTTEAAQYVYAVQNAGASSQLLRVDMTTGASYVLGPLSDPDDPDDPIRGEDLQGLSWQPLLMNPFTGTQGALIATDASTDELVIIDYRPRFPTADVFAIYVAQSDENSSIAISHVPNLDEDVRNMLPYEGSAGDMRVFNAQSGDLLVISPASGTGEVYIGARTEDINPNDPIDDLRPILIGNLNQEFGVRAANVDDLPTDPNNDLSAGIVLAQSLLAYVSAQADLVDKLLGQNLDNVTEIAVSTDGTIVVVDFDGVDENGNAIGSDQIATVDPTTGQAAAPVAVTDAATGMDLAGISAMDYGDHDPAQALNTGWMEGNQQLFAIYNITDARPTTTIGGDLGADFDIVGLTVTTAGLMYAIDDRGGAGTNFDLYQVVRDADGAITAFTLIGEIMKTGGAVVTEISSLEANPYSGVLYMVGLDPDSGDQTLYRISTIATDVDGDGSADDSRATPIGALATGVLVAGNTIKGLAFTPYADALYAVIDDGGNDTLYEINQTTGAATIAAIAPAGLVVASVESDTLVGVTDLGLGVVQLDTTNAHAGWVLGDILRNNIGHGNVWQGVISNIVDADTFDVTLVAGAAADVLAADGVETAVATDIEDMDFTLNGQLVAIDKSLGAGATRLVLINTTIPACSTGMTAAGSVSDDLMAYASDRDDLFYSVNSMGVGTDDQVWVSPGEVATLGTLSATTGLFTQIGGLQDAASGFTIQNVQTMAFKGNEGSVPTQQGLYVVTTENILYEVDPATGAIVSAGYVLSGASGTDTMTSINNDPGGDPASTDVTIITGAAHADWKVGDFVWNDIGDGDNWAGYITEVVSTTEFSVQLVHGTFADINDADDVAWNSAVDIRSMDFTIDNTLLAHDRPNGRLVDIVLLQNLDPFDSLNPTELGGALSVGSNVATTIGSLRPTISAISYDAVNDRFLTVDNATGSGSWAGDTASESSVLMYLKGYTSTSATSQNADSILIAGTVTGRVNISGTVDKFYAGWLVTGDARGQAEGSPTIEDNFYVGGDIRNLITTGSIGTNEVVSDAPVYMSGFDMEVGGKVGQVWTLDSFLGSLYAGGEQLLVGHDGYSVFQYEVEDRTDEEVDPEGQQFQNFALFRTDGAFNNDTFATAQYLGTTRNPTLGQPDIIAVNGQIQGDPIGDYMDYYAVALLAGQTVTVQLQDSSGLLDVGVFDPDGRLVATDVSRVDPAALSDQAFRFTADRAGVFRFAVGGAPFDGTTTYTGTIDYELYISDLGDLALGGVVAAANIFSVRTDSPTFLVDREDLGAISAGGSFFAQDAGTVTVSNGTLRSIEAAEFGLFTAGDGGGSITDGLILSVSTDVGLLHQTDATLGMDFFLTCGGDVQIVDGAGNVASDIFADGGLGVLRAGSMAWTNYAPTIVVNNDNAGNDGIIDLIDIMGDLGTISAGGPSISTGPNGNVRYMKVGGEIFQDSFFGIGDYFGVTLQPGQTAQIRDDSGGFINIAPRALAYHPQSGQAVDPDTGRILWQNELPSLTYRTYGIRDSGGAVLVDVTSTEGFQVSANSNGVGSPVEIGTITVNGQGRPVTIDADGNLVQENLSIVNRDLDVRILGNTANPIDVFEIIGGNFSTISNSTGGEIVNIQAESIAYLVSSGSIGVPVNHTGAAVNQIADVAAGAGFVPADYPFVQQHVGIVVNGHVILVRASGAIGNLMVNGNIGQVLANFSDAVNHADGRFDGIAAPIFTTGNIDYVNIGEGIAPTGNGEFAHAGIFAQGVIGTVVNQGAGSDIRGDIIGSMGVQNVTLTNGSIIQADIMAASNLDASQEYTGIVLSGDVGTVQTRGIGGIIGSTILGQNINAITVRGGFGLFNCWISTVTGDGDLGPVTVDGFGVRTVNFTGSGSQGNLTATGRGQVLDRTNYESTTRYSELLYTYDPIFNQLLSPLNDIQVFLDGLGLPAADVDRAGLVYGILAQGTRSLGLVSGYRIQNSRFNFANSIQGFQTYPILAGDANTNSIDTVRITTGSLGSFNPARDVNALDLNVAGVITRIQINGNLLGTSDITAWGPNGRIQYLGVAGNMAGNITSNGTVGTIMVGGNMTGQITVHPINPVAMSLQTLQVNGTYTGVLDIEGNVGSILIGLDFGIAGDTLAISGNLTTLQVGRIGGGNLDLDLNVLGNVGTITVTNGQVNGDVFIGGNLTTFSASRAGGNVVTGDVTVLGRMNTFTVTGGNLASDVTVGDYIGTVRITNGDLAATSTVLCSFGNIQLVNIQAGDLLGIVSAPNGTIYSIIVTGSDLGAASEIHARNLTTLRVDGSILAGALIQVDNELRLLQVGGNIQAGAVINIGSLVTMRVSGSVLGDLTFGYNARGTTLNISGNLGANLTLDSNATLTIGGNIIAGATLIARRDLTRMTVSGAILGDVIVEGKVLSITAGAVTGGVIVTGLDLQSLTVNGSVTNSLIQVGISRGDDGVFGTGDLNEMSRMGTLKQLTVRGNVTGSVIAAGGDILSATVSGALTGAASISSGFSVGGVAVAAVIADPTPLANAAERNAARSGADRVLLRGDFRTATVRGAMTGSYLSAGVDPGAAGTFAVPAVSTSVTGGASKFTSISAPNADAASRIVADAGLGRATTGAAALNANVTYALADINGGVPLEHGGVPNLVVTRLNSPQVFDARLRITITGPGEVRVYDDVPVVDNIIKTLVIAGTTSATRITLENMAANVTIGRILTEDDTAVGTITYDGTLEGNGNGLWLDAGVTAFTLTTFGGGVAGGRIGGNVTTMTLGTQNAGELYIGGTVSRLTINNGTNPLLIDHNPGAANDAFSDMGITSAGAAAGTWVFNTRTNQLERWDILTQPAPANPLFNVTVQDALNNTLTLSGLDFDGADVLYATAPLWNQSPTQEIGDLSSAAVSLTSLAVASDGSVMAIENASLVSLNGDLSADYNDFVAVTLTTAGNMYAVRNNGGTFELYSVDRDASGTVTGATYIGDIQDSLANAVTNISTLENLGNVVYLVGTRLAVNPGGDMELFTIDLATGEVSNALALTDAGAIPVTDTIKALAFSQDGTKLYAVRDVAGVDTLYRINLASGLMTEIVGATLGTGEIQVVNPAGASFTTDIEDMDIDATGNILALDRGTGAGTGWVVRINVTNPGLSVNASDAGWASADAMGFASNTAGEFFTIDSMGVGVDDVVLRSAGRDYLVQINTTTGGKSRIGALRDTYGNYFFNDVYQIAFSGTTLYAILYDADGMGGNLYPTDGAAIARIGTTASGDSVRVSRPTSTVQPPVRLSDGAFVVDEFTAMSVNGAGTIYAVRRTAGGEDHLVTITTAGVTTAVAAGNRIQVDFGGGAQDTDILGMGFNAAGRLIAYNNDGAAAALIAVSTATPNNSTPITTQDALNVDIDTYAIGRSGANYTAYAYDEDVFTFNGVTHYGMLYQSPGTVETLGIVDTVTGDFVQLRPLAEDLAGTPLSSNVLALAIDTPGAGQIFVVTADGRLAEYDPADGSLASYADGGGILQPAIADITDAISGQSLNVVAMDFDNATGELIGIDGLNNQFVTIDFDFATHIPAGTTPATAVPRIERGSVDGADLAVLAEDPAAAGTFYSFSLVGDDFVEFVGTTQNDLGGITLNSVTTLTLGANYAGRILATGNTFQRVTVTGDFYGNLYTSGNIVSFSQTGGNFAGSLYAFGNINSVSILGGHVLEGGRIEAGGTLGSVIVNRGGGNYDGVLRAGTVRSLYFAGRMGPNADLGVVGNIGTLTVAGNVFGETAFGSVTTLTVGSLQAGSSLVVTGDVSRLTVAGGTAAGSLLWVGGYVGSLTVGGVHRGTLAIDGGLGRDSFQNITNAFVVIGEDTGSVTVLGSVTNSVLSFGTTLGADGLYNTDDDRITGGTVTSVTVRGNFLNSAIVAGVLPALILGPGLPADLRAYTGNSDSADMNLIDSAECGGLLDSRIGSLTIMGRTVNAGVRSVAAAESIGSITLSTPGQALWTRQYVDPIGPPELVNPLDGKSAEIVSDVEARIYFTEELNTGSLVLSQDIDGDGTVTGPVDVLGSVLVTDAAGNILNDVVLSYTTQQTPSGVTQGVLILRRVAGFDENISVTLSGEPSYPDPVVYGRSGLRSSRMNLTAEATKTMLPTNTVIPFTFVDVPGTFLEAYENDASSISINTTLQIDNSFESYADVDVYRIVGTAFQYFSAQYVSAADAIMGLFFQDTQGTATLLDDTFEAVARWEEIETVGEGIFEAFELPGTGNYFLVVAPGSGYTPASGNTYTLNLTMASSDTNLVATLGGALPAGEEIAYVSHALGEHNNNLGFNPPKQLVYLDFDGGTATKYAQDPSITVDAFDVADFAPVLDGNETVLIEGNASVYGIVQHILDIYTNVPASYLDPQGNPGTLNAVRITSLAEWNAGTEGLFFTTVDPATWGLNPETDFTTVFTGNCDDPSIFRPGLLGKASEIDVAGQTEADNAIVFAQSFSVYPVSGSINNQLNQFSRAFANTIAHELGHTLGLNHQPTTGVSGSWMLVTDDPDNNPATPDDCNLGSGLMSYPDLITDMSLVSQLGTAPLTSTEFPIGDIDTVDLLIHWFG